VRVDEVYSSTGSLGFHTIVIESNVPELYASAAGAILFSIEVSEVAWYFQWEYSASCILFSLRLWLFNIYRKKARENENYECYNKSFLTSDFLYFLCCVSSLDDNIMFFNAIHPFFNHFRTSRFT